MQGVATQSLETIRILFPIYYKDDMKGLDDDEFINNLEEKVIHRAENGQRLKAVYLDIIQVPGLEANHILRDRHKKILPRYGRVRDNVDTLEIQYRSSKWLGDAELHTQYDSTAWMHDWDFGALRFPCKAP